MNSLSEVIDCISKKIQLSSSDSWGAIRKGSSQLTEKYRSGISLSREEEFLAYMLVRLPATYAVLCQILTQIPMAETLLDLGAGPGTSFWAVQEAWGNRPIITGWEQYKEFIDWGIKIGSQLIWKEKNFLHAASFEPHDWVLLNYSLGEVAENQRALLLERCWDAAKFGMILVEPGTPRGNQNILSARSLLIGLGAHVLAPCPHSFNCPLTQSWCHFSVQVERSFLHRLAKSALLPFEEEKFSYVILSKEKGEPKSRIIHSPLHRSGHTHLSLCTQDGLSQETISRRHKERYRQARNAHWGDPWD